MQRVLAPEWLDELPPDDPRAIRSRADLRRINFLMGNAPLLARLILGRMPTAPRTVVELGSGDGTFMLALARRLAARWQTPVQVKLLDMQPVIARGTIERFLELGWTAEIVKENLNDWLAREERECDLMLANLFLHHFSDERLRDFFGKFARRCQAFASCDPRRWHPALFSCRLLGLIGCNEVTRHDAVVSVRAGFRDRELTRLWPKDPGFELVEKPGAHGSHLFFARRVG